MIRDIMDLGPEEHTLHADICVIGTGAAGITIAREFIGNPASLLVLEGGGPTWEKASQEPYQSDIVGLKHLGVHEGRARVLGGTTTLWAGQVLPLLDVDLRKRYLGSIQRLAHRSPDSASLLRQG